MVLIANLRHFILAHEKRIKGPLVVAVSGGVDSMVLVDCLRQLDYPFILAHFNHGLREESQYEEEAIINYCQQHHIEYQIGHWDSRTDQHSEDAARQARYQFLARVCQSYHASTILTGHHREDQSETLLMRLLRGTSFKGLRGIQDFSYQEFDLGIGDRISLAIARPFLNESKQTFYHYANKHQLTYFEDQTNQTSHYLRNRIRQQFLPWLRQENPAVDQQLTQFSHQIKSIYQVLLEDFNRFKDQGIQMSQNSAPSWSFDLSAWEALSDDRRLVYMECFFEEIFVHYQPDYKAHAIKAVAALMINSAKPNGRLDLGSGWQAVRNYDRLVIQKEVERESQVHEHPLALGQTYQLGKDNQLSYLKSDLVEGQSIKGANKSSPFISIPLKAYLPDTSRVRTRRAGDWLKITDQEGKAHRKKLARYFIDCKIPLALRDQLPILVSSQQEVIWIPGLFIHPDYRAGERDEILAYLIYTNVGHS
ncbi:tRNA lysidine(34) synthetase TilS [Hutsoniella sourekii]|uniref:tRNA lysidine(34) synthetase TilS n=1 Tax=Hutsoniella sourekii TaxID=87650 RepID=UPI0004814A52|nr:tRNA lysidine(34) synthetase TilS [Hutsoniella sourekii]